MIVFLLSRIALYKYVMLCYVMYTRTELTGLKERFLLNLSWVPHLTEMIQWAINLLLFMLNMNC